jgi:hypothetical protein
MHIFDPCCFSSDLPGVNPTTNDRMIIYYCLMTKVDRSLAIVRYFPGRVVTLLCYMVFLGCSVSDLVT